ncbi:hypothetical protein DFH11DRAFT_1711662, partial [Phellopilus nigrolimitatus]
MRDKVGRALTEDDVYVAWAAQCVNLSSMAALAFIVWDVLTTLDEEAECIWRKPFTWSKALFVFIRYFAIATQIALIFVATGIEFSSAACYAWYIFQAVAMQVFISSVEIVLMLRVHALYGHNIYVKKVTLALFAVEVGVMAVCLYATVHGLQFDDLCIVTHSPMAILGYGVAAIAFETVLFLLTLAKFVQALHAGWAHTQIMQLLIRDGTWAFGAIFATMTVNAVAYCVINGPLSGVGFAWLLSVAAAAGGRLLLNVLRLNTPASLLQAGEAETLADTHLDFHSTVEETQTRTQTESEENGQRGTRWRGRSLENVESGVFELVETRGRAERRPGDFDVSVRTAASSTVASASVSVSDLTVCGL